MKITKHQLKRIISEVVADNVTLEVIDGSGERINVQVPYYIITDALDDGLTSDGLFIEIDEFVQANYHLNAWDFTEQSEKEIEDIWDQYNQGGLWSDEEDHKAGFYR
jgi:hypothetical protein